MITEITEITEPSLIVLVAALSLDLICGEPRNAFHPVAWMGQAIGRLLPLAPARGALVQLLFGALLTALVTVGFASSSALALASVARWPIAEIAVAALLFKVTFAVRALGQAGAQVRTSLQAGDLAAARRDLQSLCSRDPQTLSSSLIAAAAVESLAENTSDSFVAPVFYYVLFGVPGAALYRAVNTLDAMIGYRGRYEYLGKVAARLDDLLNLIPARLTAGFLLLAAFPDRIGMRRGLAVLRRDRAATASPNAGRPMAAMAGILGIALEKPGHYCLGTAQRAIDASTIAAAWRLIQRCTWLVAVGAALAIGARRVCAP